MEANPISKACIFIDVPSAIFNVVYHKIVTYKMKSDKPNKVREVGGKSQGCGDCIRHVRY